YVVGDAMMEVDIALGAEPRLGAPRELFKRTSLGRALPFGWPPGYDVSALGDRFLVVEPLETRAATGGITVVENWTRAVPR
ncbi:MAG TPA: hypothetical protein VFV75_19625, partial [Candidatus Polarisedimenticolaceae bacterium]|nr:hypothetical protein [Candidatus Polarisedimenticolaceae bacterium]